MPNSDTRHTPGWLEDEIDVNACVVSGTVERDPEMRRTPDGAPYADFLVASNELRVGGERLVKHTNRIEVRAHGPKALRSCERLRTGMRVIVHGSLDYREEDVGDRGKRGVLRVAALEIKPIGRARSGPFAPEPRSTRGGAATPTRRPDRQGARPRAKDAPPATPARH
jgi:single-stranded DNA-binding protein